MSAAGHLRQVIIAGRRGQADTQALLDATYLSFVPDKVSLQAWEPFLTIVTESCGLIGIKLCAWRCVR